MPRRPNVGVATLIFREGKILLGIRTKGKLVGWYAPPGGHLEWGETFEAASERETEEESTIKIFDTLKLSCYNRIIPEEDHHYVVVFMLALAWTGEHENVDGMEWDWYDPSSLPDPTLPAVGWVLRDHHDLLCHHWET